MKLLLDVNLSIAAICGNHTENGRVLAWIASLKTRTFITCPIVELGFVRITVATRLRSANTRKPSSWALPSHL